MKKRLVYSFLMVSALFFASCDKVENPYETQTTIDLDTSLYPGLWQDYLDNVYPVFPTNLNTDINVLIEDYTGHLCNNCPTAATIAHSIHENNPQRVFVASIHTDPGAQLSFQAADPNASSYYTDHTNPDAIAYGEEFQNGFNFIGNPQGTVNRKTVDSKMFDFSGTWQSRANDILVANDLKFNLQSVFNSYPTSDGSIGGYLHVEIEKLTPENIEVKTVVYVIQDSLVDWQLMPDNTSNPNYVHRDLHLGSIDGNPFGVEAMPASAPSSTKNILDYSYKLPPQYDASNMHFLIYVYNVETYEILQVIKQKLE
ncbi:MAG: Omp28-related outer membrane protein [Brumimicrobium sp.]|nr:Omp28-related outer membrane protein [Brumimicrobium sp.]